MGLMKHMVRGLVVVTLMAALVSGLGVRSAAAVKFAFGQEVMVNTDFLNLRSGSSLDSAVIDVLPYGTTGTVAAGPVSADGYAWYFLNLGSQQGWVAGGFLSAPTVPGGGWPVGTTLEVTDGPLNLRCCHGIGTTIVGTLIEGVQVEIIDGPVYASGYSWYAVYVETGSLGWVAGEFLGPIGSDGGAAPPPSGGFAIGSTVAVDANALNFRIGPSLSAEIANVLPNGVVFEVVGRPTFADGYQWVQIRNEGYGTGWVATEFLAEI